MFDIGWGELVVIGVIALIVIGPKELPVVLRTVGRYMGKVRRMASEFQGQFQEALREAELHDLKQQAEEFKSSVDRSLSDIASVDPTADTRKEIESAFTLDEQTKEPAAVETSAVPEALPAPAEHEALPAPAEPHTGAEPQEAAPAKSAGSTA